jgi:hypothetical protein
MHIGGIGEQDPIEGPGSCHLPVQESVLLIIIPLRIDPEPGRWYAKARKKEAVGYGAAACKGPVGESGPPVKGRIWGIIIDHAGVPAASKGCNPGELKECPNFQGLVFIIGVDPLGGA